MARPQVLEGTWEELKLHDKELSGRRFRLIPIVAESDESASTESESTESAAQKPGGQAPRELTGMGKFAGIIPNSEEFMRQKQEELELEERKFRR